MQEERRKRQDNGIANCGKLKRMIPDTGYKIIGDQGIRISGEQDRVLTS